MQAHQRLASIPHALHQQIYDRQSISDAGIARNRSFPSIGQTETVHEQQGDHRRKRQSKRCDADLHDSADLSSKLLTDAQYRQLFFPYINKRAHHCHSLPQDRRPCRTGHTKLQHPDKQIVQYNIHSKSGDHCNHRKGSASVITDQRHNACRKYLKRRPVDHDPQIFLTQGTNRPLCPQKGQHRIHKDQHHSRQYNTRQKQQPQRCTHILVSVLLLSLCTPYRPHDCTAHSDSGARRLHQRHHRIYHIDRRKSDISDTVSYKKAIYNCINTRKCKRQYRRHNVF